MSTSHRRRVCILAIVVLHLTVAPSTWSAGAPAARPVDPRSTFHLLLADHVHLIANTTGSALGARTAELAAAVRALDVNGRDLARALGAVYGADAERRFVLGWRQHIDFFLLYAKGAKTSDPLLRDKAIDGLERYAVNLAAFMSSANPHLPRDAVAALVRAHARAVLAIVDAQAVGDHAKAYASLRAATLQSTAIADPLGSAILQQFPDRFGR